MVLSLDMEQNNTDWLFVGPGVLLIIASRLMRENHPGSCIHALFSCVDVPYETSVSPCVMCTGGGLGVTIINDSGIGWLGFLVHLG